MDFGLFDQMDWSEGDDLGQIYSDRLRTAGEADRLGFYCYHLAEHHLTRTSADVSVSVFMSAVSQRTSRIRLGPLVYVLPIRNALHLAEEISMLDVLSGGRLEVGLGSGISPLELQNFGLEPKLARERGVETTQFILKYFGYSGIPISFAGTHINYKDIEPLILPIQKPHPPIWVPSRNLETTRWLAENKINTAWIFDDNERIREAYDLYKHVATESRLGPRLNQRDEEPKLGLARHVYVDRSDDTAKNIVTGAINSYSSHLNYLGKKTRPSKDAALGNARDGYARFDPTLYDDIPDLMARDVVIAGSPKTVARKVKRSMESTGANYFMGVFSFGNLKVGQVLNSIDLFAAEIIPGFQ